LKNKEEIHMPMNRQPLVAIFFFLSGIIRAFTVETLLGTLDVPVEGLRGFKKNDRTGPNMDFHLELEYCDLNDVKQGEKISGQADYSSSFGERIYGRLKEMAEAKGTGYEAVRSHFRGPFGDTWYYTLKTTDSADPKKIISVTITSEMSSGSCSIQ
jgi:hypothetical protein